MRLINLWVILAMAGPTGIASFQDLPSLEQLGVRLNGDEVADLRRGRVLVKMLDTDRPSDMAVFVGSRIDVRPDPFFEALRDSATLWRGPKVPRTGAFSSPARTSDVESMQLPPGDVEALRHCRPGDCDVKLAASEMARLRAAIDANPGHWRSAAQTAFKGVVLDRLSAYCRDGLAGLQPFHDHPEAITPASAFREMVAGSAISAGAVVPLIDYLGNYPRTPLYSRAEHMFWLEVVGAPKPTIQAAHVIIDRALEDGAIEVVAVSRQIFATHYINGSLAVTVLVRAPTGERFMLYLNRSSVDGLGGLFSGLKRLFIRGRVHRAAQAAFEHLKRGIENYPGFP